jgi:hypothetical protein
MAGNQAPGQFLLTSPPNASSEKTALLLDWEDTSDPEGNPFTYTVLISRDKTFVAVDYRLEHITQSTAFIGPGAGLKDLTTYYWKVLAVDAYGAVVASGSRSFSTNNTNGLPGLISGYVTDAATGNPISGALVHSSISGTVTAGANGSYLMAAPGGDLTLSASAD